MGPIEQSSGEFQSGPLVIHGDNLDALVKLEPQLWGRVHLVYLDPPFATGKTQTGPAGSFRDSGDLVKWRNRFDVLCQAVKYTLHESGNIVVHIDYRTSHLARCILDSVFGPENFASEIVWHYRRWPSKTDNFQRRHDTLIRYTKCKGKHRWNQLYEPLSASTLATFGTRKQRAEVVGGKRKRSTKTTEESLGVPMGDVWEIPIIAPVAKERTGYPTQKPEKLYERIVLSTTNPGDLVLDLFCGSGSMLAVCKKLNRNAIGVDSNAEAIRVTRERVG